MGVLSKLAIDVQARTKANKGKGRQLAVAKKAPVKKASAKKKAVRPTKALSKRPKDVKARKAQKAKDAKAVSKKVRPNKALSKCPVDMDARKIAAANTRVKKFAMGVKRFAAKVRKVLKANAKKPAAQQRIIL